MASPTYNINVLSNGNIEVEKVQPPTPSRKLFWVPHDKCRYSYDLPDWRYNPAQTGKARLTTQIHNIPEPEVYRLDPEHSFKLNSNYMQLLVDINPELLPDKALGLLAPRLAFCNFQFGVFDQPRFMGGATVTGDIDGDRLWLRALRADRAVPSAEEVLADQTLWFWCVSVTPKNTINYWARMGKDGQRHRCRMFLIADRPVYVQLNELKPVDHIIEDATAML